MIKNKMADVTEAITDPRKPDKVFIDADPIAYKGACIAEKKAYQWFSKTSEEAVSEVLPNAAEAKIWFEFFEMTSSPEVSEDLERKTITVLKDLDEALQACDEVVSDYLKTAKKFCKDGDFSPVGYLTESNCIKIKDISGLENRYQFNRTTEKPTHLKQCREYLLKTYPWIKMAETGFEADTHVIALAEKHKDRGLVMSIDKDLDQCENTWYINMNPSYPLRKAIFASPLGELWEETNSRGKVSVKGNGFKWLCLQAAAGDASDGYKGLGGFGPKAALTLLADAKTKEECIIKLKEFYDKKLEKGILSKEAKLVGASLEAGKIKYLSWDGKKVKLGATELMQQHFFLAYQERGSKDQFNVEYYLTKGE